MLNRLILIYVIWIEKSRFLKKTFHEYSFKTKCCGWKKCNKNAYKINAMLKICLFIFILAEIDSLFLKNETVPWLYMLQA